MSWLLLPFTWLLATVFELSLESFHSPGLSIVILSVLVTFLLLPVQLLIDWLKLRLLATKEKMRAVEEEIERCYTGQTKFMYLQTLYRQHDYNPVYNFISLAVPLIQIPFFLAAYDYLSKQTAFNGHAFLGISDLSRADGLLSLGGLKVNLLPILMSLANLLNVELITGEKKSEKTMLRYLALAFLLALYSMPGALVLYWTMNNVFLLLINLIKFREKKLLRILLREWLQRFSQFKSIRHFWPEVNFSFIAYALFCLLLSWLYPTKGSLTHQLLILSSIGCVLIGLILFAWLFRQGKWKATGDSTSFMPVYILFMFSSFPVVHYAYENIDFLNAWYLWEIFIFLLFPSFLLLATVKLTLARFFHHPFYLVFTAALILTFFLTPVWVSVFKVRIEEGFWFQVLLGFILTVLLTRLYTKNYRLLVIISVCLFSVSFGRFSSRLIKRMLGSTGLESKVTVPTYFPKQVSKKPDIYFLIYDAYITQRFAQHLKIENGAQFDYLKQQGFTIYEDKLSLDRTSLKSIAPVFSMGKTSLNDRKVIVGNNALDKFLKVQGYATYYVAKDYFFREEKENAKGIILTPNEADNTLLAGILQGEFKFETISSGYNYKKWKAIKRELFTTQGPVPRFVYSHSPYPAHAQFSGSCLKDEKARYVKRLAKANQEMKEDIENILATNPNAIIITAGDHGAYQTGDCSSMSGFTAQQITGEHLVDRYGVHIAIRWPDQNFQAFDDFDYLQGLFYSVLAYMGEDEKLLQYQPQGKVCLKGVCGSYTTPITDGPDKGKMLFNSF